MQTQTLTATTVELDVLLHAIAAQLHGPQAGQLSTLGVGLGLGGSILFNCHYAAYTGQTEYYTLAQEQLEQVLGQLSPGSYKSDFGTNYYQELAELGNLICHLIRNGHLEWDAERLLGQFDTILDQRLRHLLEQKNLERINGAVGIGTYFLRRVQHSEKARQTMDMMLEALQTQREGNKETGYYWVCRQIVEPRVYTGLAHGSALVINFLTSLHEAGFRQAECAELMHYAIKFLLNTRLDPQQYLSSFPLWRGKQDRTNNLSLPYGDLSTAYAILRAADALGNLEYWAEAAAIALRTTHRTSLQDTYLHDASIFYGVSGAHLVYAAFYQRTGLAEFNAAARYWLEQIPARANQPNEYLNFSSFFFQHPTAQVGFNLGLTGIGLTLLQALSGGTYALDEFIWLA